MRLLSSITISSFALVSCSAPPANFTGKTPGSESKGTNSKSSSESVAAAPTAAASPSPTPSPAAAVEKSQECWFAVSGTYVGLGDYSDTFPKPSSGNKIAPGEEFDTVGGVFLAARAEPYIYGQGGKEIDKAVDNTFDGIVVPPGMSVEIRPSANEPVIYQGQGPLIAIAGSDGGTGYGSPFTFKAKYDAGDLSHWPQWMLDYLKGSGGRVQIIPTHPGKWVKVSVVDGGRCASN